MSNELIVLSGPTAAGKTSLSIELAKRINGEIISADSMQVYKHMNIGTAKIRQDEMDGITHHLIDIIEPDEEWSVNRFKDESVKAINEIYSKGKIPIIVGGTGFYIQAVLYDIDFTVEDGNKTIRNNLEDFLAANGPAALHEKLAQIDPESANEIHPNNTKRVIRAIEFFLQNNTKISEHNAKERNKLSPYNFEYFVLYRDREILYPQIDKRVDIMLNEGLVDEVKKLKEMGYDKSYVSMQGIGYKEIFDYLNGDISLQESIRIIKRDTRHFAKRQMTWFKREKDVTFVDKDSFKNQEQILEYMMSRLYDKRIIGR